MAKFLQVQIRVREKINGSLGALLDYELYEKYVQITCS